jgi:hypothetical protein
MEGITIAHTDHRVVITVDTDVVDRHRIEQALSLLESDDLLDVGLARAMQETANDDEVDLEEAKRIVGRA